jgi:phosphatidylserine/phosphatidylglycerophosphate/cardiolipin synthase-like enzyme
MKRTSPRFAGILLLLNLPALTVGESFLQTPATAVVPANAPSVATTQSAVSVETHFFPEEEISPTIIKLIDGSQHSLDIAAYAFTHTEIAAAVTRAHQRGVHVRMMMDLKNASGKDSRIPDLIKAGIQVRIRHKDGDQHSKCLIIYRSIVVTGTFNYTARADKRNSENIVVIRNAPKVDDAFAPGYHTLIASSEQKKN